MDTIVFNKEEIDDLFNSVLFKKENIEGQKNVKLIFVKGLREDFEFLSEKIKSNSKIISRILSLFQNEFVQENGCYSGTFFHACDFCAKSNELYDDDCSWSSYIETMDRLFSMGIACNLCKYESDCPREFWRLLKEGPEIIIKSKD